jgi:cyclase
MQRERVTNNTYVFTSSLYAQVTAGAVITEEGAVLIDTLMYPDETLQIKQFVEERLGKRIRWIVNTHFHADHTVGTCLFPNAQIISHKLCRQLLDQRGRESLELARVNSPELRNVKVVLPQIIFDTELTLYLGGKTLQLWSTPGHSMDSIVCSVKEDQVLFAGDTLIPIPYFIDGDYNALVNTLQELKTHRFENIVQGHGEVILRGEVCDKIESDINYLVQLREKVDDALTSTSPQTKLNSIDIEDCGKSRILLNGMVQQLHRQNVNWLAEERRETLRVKHP